MHTLWHKAIADLGLSKSRSLLAVASMAAGVFCVGVLFGMIDLQLSQMDAAHRLSQPSHINLILRGDADMALLAKVKALPGVAAVDTQTPVSVRFRRSDAAAWELATLIVRADYAAQRFDKISLDTGRWPSAGQIAVENLSARYTGLRIGDSLELETKAGNRRVAIGGVVRHPFVKPPKFGGQLHFFTDPAGAAGFGVSEHTFRQLLLQVTPPYSEDKARAVASEASGLLSKHGITVNVTLLQDPEKHWGRPFMAGINGVLQIMAMVSLVLASVLILNTVSAHIAQQTDQIGVMKALGGGRFTIASVYLLEILGWALLAIALAMPIGLLAAYLSACQLLAVFNIDCGDFHYSPRAVYLMVLGGILAPLSAALGPIWRRSGLNVRIAMASYGLGVDFGGNRFDFWVERLGARCLSTLHAAALGNLFRHKGRFVLTQSVLIIAGILFMVLMSLAASLNFTLDNEMDRSRYTVRLGFATDQPADKIREIALSLPSSRQIEVWRRLPLEMAKNGRVLRQKGSLGAQMLALPAAVDMYRPLIESGRWFNAEDVGQPVLVLSADTAALNGIRAGDWLDVAIGSKRQRWQAIGTYRWLAGTNYSVEPVYAPLETIQPQAQQPELATFALIQAPMASLAEEADYLRALKSRFQAAGMPLDVYNTQAKLEQRQFARNQFKPMLGTLMGLASMIAAVGGIGLSGTLAIGVLQRTREIGVLRAIGAPSKAIFGLFLSEGLLHGMLAWVLSLPLAYLAAEPMTEQLGRTLFGMALDFTFAGWAAVYWLGMVLGLAGLASYWPARKAAGMTVGKSLAH